MFEEISGWLAHPAFGVAIRIVLILCVLWAILRVLRGWISRRVTDLDVRYSSVKSVTVIGYVLAGIVIVTSLAGQFSGLSIAIGAASAGVAFALQEVIASFAGWVAISFSNFYRVGDRVQVGGIRGDVIDIGFLRTTLMEIGGWINADLYNGRIVRVANSFVFKEPVFNYSGDFPFLWDEIRVPVRYGSDYELARRILQDVAMEAVGNYTADATERWAQLVRQYRIEDARIQPSVTLAFNDNWVDLTLRYLVDFKTRRSVQDRLYTTALARIEATGDRVRLASATFEIVAAPPIRVEAHLESNDKSIAKEPH